MPDLSVEQRLALDDVRRNKAARTDLRAKLESEYRERVKRETEAAELALSRSVRRAVELGVPKRRIGVEGLSTRDPYSVNRVLERTENEARAAAALEELKAPAKFREVSPAEAAERGFADPDADAFVQIAYPGFPTGFRQSDLYPDVLEGLVKRVHGLWYVLEDPSDFIAWELDDLEGRFNHGTLKALLEAHVARVAA